MRNVGRQEIVAGCTSLNSSVTEAQAAQGWDTEGQKAWANATQGSRLMPLSWFQALAQPDGTAPFMDDAYLASFRIVTQPGTLPIGFAVDDGPDTDLTITKLRWFAGQQDKEKWVGLNCAACHTAGVANATYIFCLPGSPGACRDAWDEILIHQLDYRYRPCNFVEILPRLDEHLRRPKAKGATA